MSITKVELTHKQLLELFTYDNGQLYWIDRPPILGKNETSLAGSKLRYGYSIAIDKVPYALKVLVYFYHTGILYSPRSIRYKNGDKFNNIFENLELMPNNSNQNYTRTKFTPDIKIPNIPIEKAIRTKFDYDSETGNLIWKDIGNVAGSVYNRDDVIYYQIVFENTKYFTATLVYLFHTGEFIEYYNIGFIDGDVLNTRIENLKVISSLNRLRLTIDSVRERVKYNPKTGDVSIFINGKARKNRIPFNSKSLIRIYPETGQTKSCTLIRLLWFLETGKYPEITQHLDVIDGNRCNLKWSNIGIKNRKRGH